MEFNLIEADINTDLKLSLLDCEYIPESKKIIILDVILYDNEKIYDDNLFERLSKIDDFILKFEGKLGDFEIIKRSFILKIFLKILVKLFYKIKILMD